MQNETKPYLIKRPVKTKRKPSENKRNPTKPNHNASKAILIPTTVNTKNQGYTLTYLSKCQKSKFLTF